MKFNMRLNNITYDTYIAIKAVLTNKQMLLNGY